MPLPPAIPPGLPLVYKARDIVTDALYELNAVASGEVPDANLASYALRKLNYIVDWFNIDPTKIFNVNFSTFTLVPNLSPHTIGPTGATFPVTYRPNSLVDANLLLNQNSVLVKTPIAVRDDAWYSQNAAPLIKAAFPTDVYYSPDMPNGNLFFWPIPTVAYGVELEMWSSFNEFATLDDSFAVPQGYRAAFMLTLAESLCQPLALQPSTTLQAMAMRARSAISSQNAPSPRISLNDSGPPTTSGDKSSFNFWTGMTRR